MHACASAADRAKIQQLQGITLDIAEHKTKQRASQVVIVSEATTKGASSRDRVRPAADGGEQIRPIGSQPVNGTEPRCSAIG